MYIHVQKSQSKADISMSLLKRFVSSLEKLDETSIAVLPGVIAAILAQDLNSTQQAILGNLLDATGDILSATSSVLEAQEEAEKEDNEHEESTNVTETLKIQQEIMQRQIVELQILVQELNNKLP